MAKSGTTHAVTAAPRMVRGQYAHEEHDADATLDEFDFLRDVAEGLANAGNEAVADRLDTRAWDLVDQAEPVRIAYAARRLEIAPQSLRPWLDRGVLDVEDGSPTRVTLSSLAEVREIVRELRAQGKDRRVIHAAFARIEGEALSKNKRFQQSVAEMKAGRRGTLPH
jgi:hypothetical protein